MHCYAMLLSRGRDFSRVYSATEVTAPCHDTQHNFKKEKHDRRRAKNKSDRRGAQEDI